MRKLDLIGKSFGRLVVVSKLPSNKIRSSWLCKCSCGNMHEAAGRDLQSGGTTSCGCYRRELSAANWNKYRNLAIEKNTKHGQARKGGLTSEYRCWSNMKDRCINPNHEHYKSYGGRGLTYDPSWETFENFYADMGAKPKRYSLERVDNNKGYSKDNCIWANSYTQANNRRTCIRISYNGVEYTCKDLAIVLSITADSLRSRWAAHIKNPIKYDYDFLFHKGKHN